MSHRELSHLTLASLVALSFSICLQSDATAAGKTSAKKIAADKKTTSETKPSTDKNTGTSSPSSTSAPAATSNIPDPAKMPATTAAQAKLTADKCAAIRRLMTVTRLPQVADKMYDMLLAQGQKSFELNLTRAIQDDSRYSEDQKKDLMTNVVNSSVHMFDRYRELLPKEINLPDVLESVSTQVYDKYFSSKELNDISDFYETPAGKKALDVLPQVMQESAQLTGEIITPKVKLIVAQIVMEERQRLESAAASASQNATTTKPATTPKDAPKTDGAAK